MNKLNDIMKHFHSKIIIVFPFLISMLFVLQRCDQVNIQEIPISENIRVNQLGYLPESPKIFVTADMDGEEFKVVNEQGKTVFEGSMQDRGTWELPGEDVKSGDFSLVKKIGTYRVVVDNGAKSHPFQIGHDIYNMPFLASAKALYYQRCSAPLEEKFAGKFARPSAFPDDTVYYHVSTGKTNGFISSPGGWFDAGDYGKYIVNAGISVSTMLLHHSLFPNSAEDASLNIPESGNGVNDLLDELKYELDWMLTMQDNDGGVFHKLTSKTHDKFDMPHKVDNRERLVIGKPTSGTLDFAATMAQGYRAFIPVDKDYAQTLLHAAEKAWRWALENNDVLFLENPPDIGTGPYNDYDVHEEFFWAAAELYVSTKHDVYRNFIEENWFNVKMTPEESWRNYVSNIGFYAMATSLPTGDPLQQKSSASIIQLANDELMRLEANPYLQPLEIFAWGSNSDIMNYALLFCIAHQLTGQEKYLDAAILTTDYVWGKNPTGYCFVTGFGSKRVQNIHHRIFANDGIQELPKGFLIGGANGNMEDLTYLNNNNLDYESKLPPKAYIDVVESFASNEICINWNAPLLFVLGYIYNVSSKNS